jgi:hypothetical protein
MLSLLCARVHFSLPHMIDHSRKKTCASDKNELNSQLTMVLARSVWLFVVTDLDKFSIIE